MPTRVVRRRLLIKSGAEICGVAPGFIVSACIAVAASASAPVVAKLAPIPAMVIALFIGIVFSRVAAAPVFRTGVIFCVNVVLRCAVALLGLRISVSDIMELGVQTAMIVVASMAITIASGFLFAAC